MNLTETGAEAYNWDAEGVYQLEVTDPVQGGSGGIANRQATELAKRTRNLHGRVQTVETGMGSLGSTKADKNNAELTGIPTAPTAAPGTNNTQVATTAFVKQEVAQLAVADGAIGYSKIAADLVSRQAIAADNIDWSTGGIYTKTLTANTTFTFSNVKLNKVITVIVSGAYTFSLPLAAAYIQGTADPAKTNKIQIHCTNATSGQEQYWAVITTN